MNSQIFFRITILVLISIGFLGGAYWYGKQEGMKMVGVVVEPVSLQNHLNDTATKESLDYQEGSASGDFSDDGRVFQVLGVAPDGIRLQDFPCITTICNSFVFPVGEKTPLFRTVKPGQEEPITLKDVKQASTATVFFEDNVKQMGAVKKIVFSR